MTAKKGKKTLVEQDLNPVLLEPVNITDYTNQYYKEYSLYVIQSRALPNYIDGLKVVQRKLIYAALQLAANKKIKVAELGSSLSSYEYLHGETSAQDALVSMAAPWKNNIPLFDGHGNFGSRLIQESAAPRYIYASLSDTFKNTFSDFAVVDSRSDNPEPITYLPVIPWSLINGISGVAVGFACNILPRDWNDIRKACIEYISKGVIKAPINVKYPHFNGSVELLDDGRWATYGIVNKEKTGRKEYYVISELPIGYDREKYFSFLLKLKEAGKISDFDDDCNKDGFKFIVYTTPDQNKSIEKDRIKFFGLIKTETENLSTIDENGELRIFSGVNDLIAAFCNFRLQKSKESLAYSVGVSIVKLNELLVKKQFIQHVVDNIINLKDFTKKELLSYVLNLGDIDSETADKIISIPSYSFTKDNILELDKTIKKVTDELNKLKNSNEKDILLDKLKKLNLD